MCVFGIQRDHRRREHSPTPATRTCVRESRATQRSPRVSPHDQARRWHIATPAGVGSRATARESSNLYAQRHDGYALIKHYLFSTRISSQQRRSPYLFSTSTIEWRRNSHSSFRYASKCVVVRAVKVACSRMQTSRVRCCLSLSFVSPSRVRKPITKAS